MLNIVDLDLNEQIILHLLLHGVTVLYMLMVTMIILKQVTCPRIIVVNGMCEILCACRCNFICPYVYMFIYVFVCIIYVFLLFAYCFNCVTISCKRF